MRAHGWDELGSLMAEGENIGGFTREKGWKPRSTRAGA